MIRIKGKKNHILSYRDVNNSLQQPPVEYV